MLSDAASPGGDHRGGGASIRTAEAVVLNDIEQRGGEGARVQSAGIHPQTTSRRPRSRAGHVLQQCGPLTQRETPRVGPASWGSKDRRNS